MSEFLVYLEVGYKHILDIHAYDHIVFLLATLAVFSPTQWKSLLICLTAFTVGHSLTLILSVFQLVEFSTPVIETFIPITILLTAVLNTFERPTTKTTGLSSSRTKRNYTARYVLIGFFGMIHGLGFSNYLKSLLLSEEDLILPLLGFNLGIELGQIVFSLAVFIIAFIWITILGKAAYHWNLFLSGAAAGVSFILLVGKLFP